MVSAARRSAGQTAARPRPARAAPSPCHPAEKRSLIAATWLRNRQSPGMEEHRSGRQRLLHLEQHALAKVGPSDLRIGHVHSPTAAAAEHAAKISPRLWGTHDASLVDARGRQFVEDMSDQRLVGDRRRVAGGCEEQRPSRRGGRGVDNGKIHDSLSMSTGGALSSDWARSSLWMVSFLAGRPIWQPGRRSAAVAVAPRPPRARASSARLELISSLR